MSLCNFAFVLRAAMESATPELKEATAPWHVCVAFRQSRWPARKQSEKQSVLVHSVCRFFEFCLKTCCLHFSRNVRHARSGKQGKVWLHSQHRRYALRVVAERLTGIISVHVKHLAFVQLSMKFVLKDSKKLHSAYSYTSSEF